MSKKSENIYKRNDGRWEGCSNKEHDSNKKAISGHSCDDVECKPHTENEILSEETVPKDSALLFSTIADEWAQLMTPKFKESTSVKYHNLLNIYILPKFGKTNIQEITTLQIDQFCNELLISGGRKGVGLSAKTVADILCLLKCILRYAFSAGIVLSYDISSIKVKHVPQKLRVFSVQEQQKLCNYLLSNPDIKNIGILLCLFTGIRIGELCALSWEDISFDENAIFVHQTMQRIQNRKDGPKTKIIVTTPKSHSSIRTIPIPEKIISFLKNLPVEKEGYFLSGSKLKFIEPRTMQNHFKIVLKKATIEEANFHTLRHTFATRCVELGFDIKSLSVILGHSNINITMNRYVHPSMELKRKNMQRLSELFSVK